MATEEPTTLIGREEKSGNTYPLFIEKLALLGIVITFIFTFGEISQQFETKWIGMLVSLVLYPFILLFIIEMLGRAIQKMHNDT